MKNKKGFTLTELLAVIAILAILSVGAISGYSTMTRNSRKKAYETKVAEIENAAIKYAKETNLTSATTISVNKLVVEGFFQPDESTDSGLASIKNPQNGENMICNIIEITINDDIYYARYDKKKKNCLIAEQELDTLEISVLARELIDTTIGNTIPINGNSTSWTNKDVLLTVSSEKYTDFNSISYSFNGETITKEKNSAPVSTPTKYVETDYDKIAIKDILVIYNNEVTITYNMNDGSTHSRTIIVRIDKESPSVKMTTSNDVSITPTKKVTLYLDDANGSGVKGFYVSKSDNFEGKPLIDSADNKDSTQAGDGAFLGYKSHFYGEKGDYYVKVIDKVGNASNIGKITLSNFDPNQNECTISVTPQGATPSYWNSDAEWFRDPIVITTRSNENIGTMGVKYFFGIVALNAEISAENKLVKEFIPDDTHTTLIDELKQDTESDLQKYHTAIKGFSTKNNNLAKCNRILGYDRTQPTISFSCTDCEKYKQSHSINITLKDDRSGFYDSAKSIKIGFSTSNTTPPTESEWVTINGGIKSNYKNASNKTIVDGNITFTTTVNYNSDAKPLTGEYYLWVKGDSFYDKAHNIANNTHFNDVIRFDNTKPDCESQGGGNNWVNTETISIYGKCSDDHSKCAQRSNSGSYSYDDEGNVTRTYTSDVNATGQSPGIVYDNAGNFNECPPNRTVKKDTQVPDAPSLVMTHSYDASKADGQKAKVYSNNTWLNAKIGTGVYMTDARYTNFKGPSATDPVKTGTTVASGIQKYQISADNITWHDYSYNYNNDMYYLNSNAIHYRYIRAIDNANNYSAVTTLTIKIDKKEPECKVSGGSSSWTKKDVKVTGTCIKPGISGCLAETTEINITSGTTNDDVSPGNVCDKAGNCKKCGTVKVKVDKQAPKCEQVTTHPGCPASTNTVQHSAKCTDSGIGHDKSKSIWYIGTNSSDAVDGNHTNSPAGEDGANLWYEGLCSGASTLYYKYHVCDKLGNCRDGWDSYSLS